MTLLSPPAPAFPLIAPSLLAADCARLGDETRAIAAAGADWLHLDVMDNHYVPNLTFGPLICQALKPCSDLPIDVHLMVTPVDPLAQAFAQAGAYLISFHPEASQHPDRTLQLIKAAGCKAGLVLNPATPLSWLDHTLDALDLVLLMSVNPGFGGQRFIPQTLTKIQATKAILDNYRDKTGRHIYLEVDGGINPDNAASITAAGGDVLVAGSAVFGTSNYAQAIAALRQPPTVGT